MTLIRLIDRWLNARTQRRAPTLLADLIDERMNRRDREGVPLWRTR